MKTITTKCLNGDLRTGDLVLSVPDDEYSCLIGRVLEINPLGSPEHDAETSNDSDDVHVDFTEYGYSHGRIKEIERMFSELYGTKKRYHECPLDDVIMAPGSLIRITGICDDRICDFKESGYNVACYCYKVLLQTMEQPGFDDVPDSPAMSGFKITRLQNGKTIEVELTASELEAAYRLREHEYYISDVEMTLEEMESDGDLRGHTADAIIGNQMILGEMVDKYTINRDKYDMEWHTAAVNAIQDALNAAERSGLLTAAAQVSSETEGS